MFIVRVLQQCFNIRRQAGRTVLDNGEQNAYRAATSSAARRRTQKKILGELIVEIIVDERNDRLDSALLLEFVDGLEAKRLARPMGRQFQYRRAVSGDDDRLAPLDFARELRSGDFSLREWSPSSCRTVATCSHTVYC